MIRGLVLRLGSLRFFAILGATFFLGIFVQSKLLATILVPDIYLDLAPFYSSYKVKSKQEEKTEVLNENLSGYSLSLGVRPLDIYLLSKLRFAVKYTYYNNNSIFQSSYGGVFYLDLIRLLFLDAYVGVGVE